MRSNAVAFPERLTHRKGYRIMKSLFGRFVFCSLVVALTSLGSMVPHAYGDDLLTIGSDAPALNVEHWVQNGEGKFGKVTKFEKGKVYVVEFWATWCGPCIMSMPHIVETQKKYAGKGVQIVSISDEPLETVEEFLERELPPNIASEFEGMSSFKELTQSYCLTTDPDRSSSADYMEAARQNGIPCAFIVGKDAKVEWIGHPMEMDSPLDLVVADKWDREKFATEFKEQQEQEAIMQEAQTQVIGLFRKKKFPEALAKLDEFVEKSKRPEMKLNLLMFKLNLHQAANSDAADVSATFDSLFQIVENNADPMMANQIAWTVWEMTEAGRLDSKDVLKNALNLAKKASAKLEGNSKSMVLDTVSHLEYALDNGEEALKVQEEAVALADATGKEQLTEFLEKLREEFGKPKK
jgi:thiol-disulfide isomerase/thioredoxin